ncbi:MAG: LacI family DNA-binding transcriptional regulator [Rhodospirillales bacterium]|nr:LacI family DNA-binding transcriptional regulator [Rhodospirillales bacterium]
MAEIAGVSTATVSRAMNRPDAVSEALRLRVAAVVDRLGWVPDGAARALATRRTGTIGAIFPTLTHGDFARALEGLQAELTRLSHTLLLACSEYSVEQEYRQVRKLVERGVDGILLVGARHHPDLMPFLERRAVPVVETFVFDRDRPGMTVGPDNRRALFRLTEHLIALGHQRIGVIAQDATSNDRAGARLAGVREALAQHGLAVPPAHFAEGKWTIREGRALFRRIASANPAPTALICGNAYLAVGAMLESQAMGIAVPGRMSIAGYDDIEIMAELPIPITTVRVSSEEVGRRAARHLIARIRGEAPPDSPECEAEIVLRASCGPAPD